jgi:hypothetical protein
MITDIQQQINSKQAELTTMQSAVDIASTENEIAVLNARLDNMRGVFADLYSKSQDSAFNTVSILEPAMLPTVPIGPNVLLITLMATLSGAVLATGAAYLLEFLDDTVKDADYITEAFDSPVIAQIPRITKSNKKVFVAENPLSQITDEFRTLRTNLEFAAVSQPLIKLAVLKPARSFTIASNLATILALSEKDVILVDCDMRSPAVHQTFGLNNVPGLMSLLGLETTEALHQVDVSLI